eukprot:scaffold9853_cov31-Tisochrysis_lutea.AAC.1
MVSHSSDGHRIYVWDHACAPGKSPTFWPQCDRGRRQTEHLRMSQTRSEVPLFRGAPQDHASTATGPGLHLDYN